MSARAGWYPDPSGNAAKLRFWDGNQWTNDFMDAAAVPPSAAQASAQSQQEPGYPQFQSTSPTTYQQGYQPGYQSQQTYQQPSYGMAYSTTTYPLSSTDVTLRLIAFVFNVLSLCSVVASGLATFGIMLIPLAWVIPMTVMCWRVYKGQRANTIAFGVCTLLFVNLVSGILLLCSTKEA